MEILSNIGFMSCILTLPLFMAFAFVFHFAGEKSVSLISGFNSFTEEQQAQYDKKQIARDYRNMFAVWSAIMLIGALLSLLVSGYFAWAAYIIFFAMIIKDFHMFPENAFAKYKYVK